MSPHNNPLNMVNALKILSVVRPQAWIKFLLYGLLLLGLYYSAFFWLVTKDWEREAYTHGFLIPFVVLFLIWFKRKELATTPSEPSWKGMLPLGLGIAFFWLGEFGGEFFTLYISFWLVVVGLCWMHLGWQKMKLIRFALVFMLAMFPLPYFLDTRLMLQLRLISSRLGVSMIRFFGLPVFLKGNVIDLGFTQLQVVEACSGLNSLFSLMVSCFFLLYFFRAHIWKRIALFISVIPLAILTNSFRIAVTALIYKCWGPEMAEGFFHGFSGAMIFIISIPVLIVEMKVLEKLPPKEKQSPFRSLESRVAPSELVPDAGDKKKAGKQILWQPMFITVVVLLSTTIAVSHAVEFQQVMPSGKSLNTFPLKVDGWTADHRQSMDQKFIDTLDLSDYLIVNYMNAEKRSVGLYVAYYRSQSKGKSIHSPATCLPGSGWSFDQAGAVAISDVPGIAGRMPVNRAIMRYGDATQIAYYWFPQRGRVLTNAYQLKIFNFLDSITIQRTDGALVRLITMVYEGEDIKDADARLKSFVRVIVPVLNKYIPGRELHEKRAEGG